MTAAKAPTPDLPRGAGGPLRRAAGRDSPRPPSALASEEAATAAIVLEPDPLSRLLVVPAVVALGFAVASGPGAAHVEAAFVPLDREDDCRRACVVARGAIVEAGRAPLVVGYGQGSPALLAAHRAHGCADAVLRLAAVDGRPSFVHLPAVDAVTAAGLTVREADVLVLLLGGLTTAAVAARLCVSESTARSHCRAVLRKLGAGDRRALRARLLAGPQPVVVGRSDPPLAPPAAPGRRFA